MKVLIALVGVVVGQGASRGTAIKLKRPSIRMVQRTAWYVGAASCPSKRLLAWECWSCKKARETKPSDVYLFSNYRKWVEGYVLVDNPNKMVVVCFRRTNNLVLGERNRNHPQVLFPDINDPRVRVNQAFSEALDTLTPLFMPYLKNVMKPGYNVMVTGFSLGGSGSFVSRGENPQPAEDPISPDDIDHLWPAAHGEHLLCPGHQRYADESCTRRQLRRPLPPLTPASNQDYTHHQNELYIDAAQTPHYCSTKVYEDPTCANHISGLDYSPTSHLNAWNVSFNPIYGC
ncbi:hypothetical protein DSO57_1011528 [Entomophthora muscae]|uniref:Uncharacterized protein n=1 Tax=Entomophthora muscae TaxID=34485 RepID=A0ACC2T644_9FUNG|nr:hypothetical protein DSO57_1011528 [Entomophthora muscae]